ncbi:MAG: hypothetical protein KDA63_09140, partial [Planctomycetales bacterium]|nr:hypothetical protein [Planctomycetales bacterium]
LECLDQQRLAHKPLRFSRAMFCIAHEGSPASVAARSRHSLRPNTLTAIASVVIFIALGRHVMRCK